MVKPYKSEELQNLVDATKDQVATYQIKREGEIISKEIVAELRPETGRGGIGVGISNTGLVRYPFYLSLVWPKRSFLVDCC